MAASVMNWLKGLGSTYKSAGDQASGLGRELAATGQMNQINQQALHPSQMAPPQSASAPSAIDLVNPGYQPVGGQNAVNKILNPPATKGFSSIRRTQPGSQVGSQVQL